VDYLTDIRIWNGELFRRLLESKLITSEVPFDRLLGLLGLGSDEELVAEFAWKFLTVPRRDPKTSFDLKMTTPFDGTLVTCFTF
jgi:hypothetical protein